MPGVPYGHGPVGWPGTSGGRKKQAGTSVPEPRRVIASWLSPVTTASRASWLLNGGSVAFRKM